MVSCSEQPPNTSSIHNLSHFAFLAFCRGPGTGFKQRPLEAVFASEWCCHTALIHYSTEVPAARKRATTGFHPAPARIPPFSLPMSRGHGKITLNRPPSSRARTRTPVYSRVGTRRVPGAILLATMTGPRACVCLSSNFRRESIHELNTRSLLPPGTEEERREHTLKLQTQALR